MTNYLVVSQNNKVLVSIAILSYDSLITARQAANEIEGIWLEGDTAQRLCGC